MLSEIATRTGRTLLALLALAGAPAAVGEPAAGTRAQLDLVVNGAQHETVLVLIRGDDVLVDLEDLKKAGLHNLEGHQEQFDGRRMVSLRSLAPLLRFAVDDRALALRIEAEARLLGTTELDLRPSARPAGLVVRGDPSGFFNYSAQLRTNGQFTGFGETGFGRDGKLFYFSGSILPGGRAVRDLTNLTLDEPSALRRWIVGDAFAQAGGLGGSAFIGGLSLVKEYGLDPYLVRGPLPRLSGFAPSPSTLDVYVNGVLVRQQPLPPGGYDLSNLPVVTGSGNVRTVLRDALGRTEVLDWGYYYSAGLLGRGLVDYGYHLGFERHGYGFESFDYGRPIFLGRHRYGVNDRLTLGGRLDAAEDLLSGGPSATVGLPWGEVELAGAASGQRGATGGAASLGYSYASRVFSGSALVRWMSDRYANASLRAVNDRPRVQANVTVGVPILPRLGAMASYAVLDYRDAGLSDVASLQASYQLARDWSLVTTANRSRSAGGSPTWGVFATLAWAVAPATMADVSMQTGSDGTGASAGIQHSLPMGTGYGYRARVSSGPAIESATGLFQYQWDYGRYELQYDRYGSEGVGTATATGGVAFIGGRAFLSRPIQDGFALMRVGVPGVRGYLEGQEVGRTDSKGDLLVPAVLPYYGNRLSIADQDVPMDYRVGATEQLAAPTWRLGVLTHFDMEQFRTVGGSLLVEQGGKELVPVYGEFKVQSPKGEHSSPIGRDGRFYFENLPGGRHSAEVRWNGSGFCQFFVDVPSEPAHVELGQLRCPPAEPARSTPPTPESQPSPPAAAEPPREPKASKPVEATPAPGAAVGQAMPLPLAPSSAELKPVARAQGAIKAPRSGAAIRYGRRCVPCGSCFDAAMDRERRAACLNAVEATSRTMPLSCSLLAPDHYRLCVECMTERRARGCR